MRLSIRPNDPGYPYHHHLKDQDRRAWVKFNGEVQANVITADSDVGMLVRVKSPLVYDKDRAAFEDEVLHGRVEIELYDEFCL